MTRVLWGALFALSVSGCSGCGEKSKPTPPVDAGAATIAPAKDAEPPAAANVPPLPADAGTGWEGAISLTVSAPLQKINKTVELSIKGDRVRYPSPNRFHGEEATTVVDVELRRLLILPEESKEYGRIDLPPADADAAAFPLVATGKKLKIQGLDCDVYETKHGKASSTACIHEGIAFVDFGMMANATPPAWMRSLSVTKRFVLRAVEIDDTGTETLRMEASKVREGPVMSRGFNAPPGAVERKGMQPGSPFRPGLPD